MNAAHSERRTLPKIAFHGYDGFEDFYVGDIARRIHADMEGHGGYITRTHAAEMPWIQIELSRSPFLSDGEKRRRVEWNHA